MTESKKNASGTKPPSLSGGLAFAHRRIEMLREVCIEVVERVDLSPATRATLLTKLAIIVEDVDG